MAIEQLTPLQAFLVTSIPLLFGLVVLLIAKRREQ